jgi:hypothetical protein
VSFQSTFISTLTGNAGLHTLVADRIWPGKWPQNPQLPYIVLFEIGARSSQSMGGNSLLIERPVMRFVINADTFSGAEAVGAALKAALVATSYALRFEDERSDVNMTNGVHRRDIDVRVAHVA